MFIIYRMERADITIVGAGIVGLAVARELSGGHKNIFVIERHDSFGQETSSRSSEVIHAGIYYPKNSLKAKTCVEGNRLIYEFSATHKIPHKRIGKLIVALDDSEMKELEALYKMGVDNGVRDLKLIFKDEMRKLEPRIRAEAAIYSPSTGIVDSHDLMKSLASEFKASGGEIAYDTELKGVDKTKDGFELAVKGQGSEEFRFSTRILVNSAGLDSSNVARMAGIGKGEYRLKYCKGDYFRVSNKKAKMIRRLVYPVPKKDRGGLGIHATLDLGGGLRLGPDDEYVERIDYNVDERKKSVFFNSAVKFLPFIELADLAPDISGIRPKLQGPSEDFKDYIIKEEAESGLDGFINLIGIESPGLTSALSIAKMVKAMIR